MIIYLLTFGLSCILLEISGKNISKALKIILVFLALLIPSLLAGLRASFIGTDLRIYGINNFNYAIYSNSFKQFLDQTNVIDFSFNVLIYISSRICSDYHLSLFIYQFITVFFIYKFLNECKIKYDISLGGGYLIYLLFLFNTSLNIMRQCIAVSIVAYSFTFVWKKKYLLFSLFICLAFTFHSTSLIGILILLLYKFLGNNKKMNTSNQFLLLTISIILMLTAMVGFEKIINVLCDNGILNVRYKAYITGGVYADAAKTRVSMSNLLIQPVLLIIILFYAKSTDKYINGGMNFFIVCCILVALINIFGQLYSAYIFRLAYYFIPFQVLSLCLTIKGIGNSKDKICIVFVIFVMVLVLWTFQIVIRNGNETYPYIFYWNE